MGKRVRAHVTFMSAIPPPKAGPYIPIVFITPPGLRIDAEDLIDRPLSGVRLRGLAQMQCASVESGEGGGGAVLTLEDAAQCHPARVTPPGTQPGTDELDELIGDHPQIAAALGIGHSTVGAYVRRAEAAGVSWSLANKVDDVALEAAIVRPRRSSEVARPEPDWAHVHRELRAQKGTTLQLAALGGVPQGPPGRISVQIQRRGLLQVVVAGDWRWS